MITPDEVFFRVHFVYIDVAGGCGHEWDAQCMAVPRVGEKIRSRKNSPGHTVVREVFHKFSRVSPEDDTNVQSITVVVGDPDVKWPGFQVEALPE